jgi:hypothetical protein
MNDNSDKTPQKLVRDDGLPIIHYESRIAVPDEPLIELPDAGAAVLDRVEDFISSPLCRVFESHGLNADQAIFVYLHRLMRVPQRHVAAMLDWSEKHAQSVRRSLDRPPARRAVAASGLLAASAAKWPGPQLGRVTALFFIPECPQVAISGRMVELGTRPLIRRRHATTRSFSFTMFKPIVITPAEVAAEIERFQGPNQSQYGYSTEYIHDLCAGRLKLRAENAQETAELARLESLTPAAAIAEFQSAQMAVTATRERKEALTDQCKKALSDWQAKPRMDTMRGLASYMKSPIADLETELAQADREHKAATKSWQALQQVVRYNESQASSKDLAELVAKHAPEAAKLGSKLAHSAPELAHLPGTDAMSSALRQLVTLGNVR